MTNCSDLPKTWTFSDKSETVLGKEGQSVILGPLLPGHCFLGGRALADWEGWDLGGKVHTQLASSGPGPWPPAWPATCGPCDLTYLARLGLFVQGCKGAEVF